MFRFPFGTTQELNLDWFLEQWEIFKQEAQTALDGIDHALDDEIQRVEDAMTDLYAARDAAIAAKNDSLSYAQSANSSAIGASQSAQNSAASAVTSATQAQSAAQSATSAQSSATNAGTSAGNALTQAQQSEAWATGEIGGVHVPPSAPQNQSNAKQYATNAQLSANAANTAKNDARVYSQDSKAWATGIRNGEPVTSEDETYQNNAKYYAESISGDAAAAAQSASDAAASAESVGQSAAQIAQNTADIEDLKSSINDLGYIEKHSSNILDPNTVFYDLSMGSDGSTWSDQNRVTSDYIEVSPNTKYSDFVTNGSIILCLPTQAICAFDENKDFLEYLGTITYSERVPTYVTTPATAKYIRICWGKVNYTTYNTIMVSETDGTTMPTEIVLFGTTNGLTELRYWVNKKWVVFGDSLTEYNIRTTKHYFDYIADITGISIYNMGDSGSGYANEQEYGTAFYQRISNVPTDCDVITIFGSWNDYSTGLDIGTADSTGTTTIGGCVNTTLDNLFTAFPLANVGIVAPTPWQTLNPYDGSSYGENYVNLLKSICEKRSIPFLDLYHCSGLRPWDATFRQLAYSKDDGYGTHPDETGHFIIASKFKGFLDTLLV